MDGSFFISLAGLGLWAASFLYFRWYLKRRTGSDRILADFGDEVDKLIADIDAATDRDVALVEDRIKSLRTILEDADRRIAALGKETDRRFTEERAYAELGRRSRRVSVGEEKAEAPGNTLADTSADTLAAVSAEVSEEPTASIAAPRFVRAPIAIEPKAPAFAERVSELTRAGFSAGLIAQRLNATVAEVDLAIALAARMDARNADGTGN